MKIIHLNKYSTAAILLMAVAAVLVAIAVTYNLGEFITAAFVISGMVCVMMGIFMLTFSSGEPIDPRLVGLIPVQNCINLCRIGNDLDITGNAYFLPSRVTGETIVMQFNPASIYKGSDVSAKASFPKTKPAGLVTIPSCNPLIQDLRKRKALVIPDNKENLTQLLRETLGEILEFAPRVSASWNDSTVTITLYRYRFIAGCQFIWQESPGCCTRHPCPACSLCGALITEGLDKVFTLDQCSISSSNQDIIMIFSLVPPAYSSS
jgi:hypothetical protein